MLGCWWRRLAERHDETAWSIDGGAAGAAEDSPYTPRMACIRRTLRKVLDSQMKNCMKAWRQQRVLPWASLLPPGEKRQMKRERKARKQACIDAYEKMSGGAESSGDVTAQYSQCEHGVCFDLRYCGHYSTATV